MQISFRFVLALALFSISLLPSIASADQTNHVVISEVQTGTSASASQEFIELYNPTLIDLSVTGWTVEYKSATAAESSWSKRATLSGTIASEGFYLIAPKTYLSMADIDWSATLAAAAGNIRIKDAGGTVVDQLGYGDTANAAEGNAPAAAPASGQSIERLPGRLAETDGNGTDTNNNAADFILRTTPAPQSTASAIEVPGSSASVVADPVDTPIAVDDTPVSPVAYAPLDITELLVDPASPLTDANDEFIELFNPTDSAVDTLGYTLKTGSNFHSFYVLPHAVIQPGGYLALYSSQTKLGLTNSGGAAELLDPTGLVIDTTPTYGAAPTGEAWARFDDTWEWTLQTTPGRANELAAGITVTKAVAKTVTPKSIKKAATKAATKKAAAKKATAKPRTKKPKLAKAVQTHIAAAKTLQPANWLLIGLGVLTIGYATYEFRHDIQAYYYKLRGHTPAGGDNRQEPEGRRGD